MLESSLKEKGLPLGEVEFLNFLKILTPEKLSQDNFKKSIYLVVVKLYELNNTKYAQIMHIADKAYKQDDENIFPLIYNIFKDELKFYMNTF